MHYKPTNTICLGYIMLLFFYISSYLFVQVSLFIRCTAGQVVVQDFTVDLHHGVTPRSRANIWTRLLTKA